MSIDIKIKEMIKDIDTSINPCADKVNLVIDHALSRYLISSCDAKKFKEWASDSVKNQSNRLGQLSILTRSQSLRLG